jgi:hypothetical protein
VFCQTTHILSYFLLNLSSSICKHIKPTSTICVVLLKLIYLFCVSFRGLPALDRRARFSSSLLPSVLQKCRGNPWVCRAPPVPVGMDTGMGSRRFGGTHGYHTLRNVMGQVESREKINDARQYLLPLLFSCTSGKWLVLLQICRHRVSWSWSQSE